MVSALAADEVLFNSEFNRSSFLGELDRFMRRIPDSAQRVLGLREVLEPKCSVLYFPVDEYSPAVPSLASSETATAAGDEHGENDMGEARAAEAGSVAADACGADGAAAGAAAKKAKVEGAVAV